jgi:hypothetical protein
VKIPFMLQVASMTQLTAEWQAARDKVASAEAALEAARVARVQAQQAAADYLAPASRTYACNAVLASDISA